MNIECRIGCCIGLLCMSYSCKCSVYVCMMCAYVRALSGNCTTCDNNKIHSFVHMLCTAYHAIRGRRPLHTHSV